MKRIYSILTAALMLIVPLTLKAQRANTTTYTFTHPCALYTQADYDRVALSLGLRENVSGEKVVTAPRAVQEAYAALKASKYTSLTYTASPVETLVRGSVTGTGVDKENYPYAMRDAAAAFQMALLWKLSGDDSYASKAVEILNAWATTCKTLTANDNNKYLCAGAQGYTFAVAAEMLLSYSGWTDTDKTTFKSWIVNVFGTMNKTFLDTHGNPSCGSSKHYWANWDLVNEASYLAIGILTENSTMVNYVVNYFYNGNGNGSVKNLCLQEQTIPSTGSGTESEQMMQCQESGRDHGHAMMSAMVAANLAQTAYALMKVQKVSPSTGSGTVLSGFGKLNFWEANDRALLKMEEYVALSNLRDGTDKSNAEGDFVMETMPFQTVGPWCNGSGHEASKQHTVLSEVSRGGLRPGFELVLNYYKNADVLSWESQQAGANAKAGFKYIEQMVSKMRPECGASDSRYGSNSGAFDQLGWGTLMVGRADRPGDANDDGTVDIADVSTVVSFLIDETSQDFNAAASDVDDDGQVTLDDIIGIVNMVLSDD